ncbi:MAG: diaminopimelate decarboxylase [Gammaproteobacteria bacterium]
MAPQPAFTQRSGVLYVAELPLPQLADEFGTPLYVYSRRALLDAWQRLATPLQGSQHQLCYAVKANGSLALLQELARQGAGFDIVSAGELARVLKAGGDPARTVFSGVGKRRDELEYALHAGVGCFNVESQAELERLNEVAVARKQRAPVALRINPHVDAHTHPYIATGHGRAKFGIDWHVAERLALQAAEWSGIRLEGLACHIGSQITTPEPYRAAAARLAELSDRLRAHGVALRHLDFGGGFGLRYHDEVPLDTAMLFGEWRALVEPRGLTLRVEPGRAVVAHAGLLLTRVEYLKEGAGHHFVVVDAGMSELIRPALYDAWHDIREVVTHSNRDPQLCDVVGPVCESADFLGRGRKLAVRAGELLAVMDAGAYGMSMASNYNARPRPAEVLVDGARCMLIRRRETLDELMAHEILF